MYVYRWVGGSVHILLQYLFLVCIFFTTCTLAAYLVRLGCVKLQDLGAYVAALCRIYMQLGTRDNCCDKRTRIVAWRINAITVECRQFILTLRRNILLYFSVYNFIPCRLIAYCNIKKLWEAQLCNSCIEQEPVAKNMLNLLLKMSLSHRWSGCNGLWLVPLSDICNQKLDTYRCIRSSHSISFMQRFWLSLAKCGSPLYQTAECWCTGPGFEYGLSDTDPEGLQGSLFIGNTAS